MKSFEPSKKSFAELFINNRCVHKHIHWLVYGVSITIYHFSVLYRVEEMVESSNRKNPFALGLLADIW